MLWKVKIARMMTSMKAFNTPDLANVGEIIFDVTLTCVKTQKAFARTTSKALAQSWLIHHSREGCAEFFTCPVHESSTCYIYRLAAAACIANNRGGAAGERFHDT